MDSQFLLKLAKENPKVREALLTLTKTAVAGDATQFSESVPAAGPQDPAMAAQPAGAPVDANQQALGMADHPEAEAARQFLAPVFQAASQGDEGAQRVIAMAAGEIARNAAPAAPVASNEEMVANQVVPPVAAAPAPGAPAPAAAPAAEPAAAPPAEGAQAPTDAPAKDGEKKPFPPKKDDKKAPPKKEEGTEKKASLMFSAETVKGLIELAHRNII